MTLMQFFTPDWRDGNLSDDDFEDAERRYDERLAQVRGMLSKTLLTFHEGVSLHDGLVKSALLDRRGSFRLELRAGDLQRGYLDVTLHYEGVEDLKAEPPVSELLNRRDIEMVADEIDATRTGTFEHRFLFAPEGELLVRFKSFSFDVRPVEKRDFIPQMPIFTELGPLI